MNSLFYVLVSICYVTSQLCLCQPVGAYDYQDDDNNVNRFSQSFPIHPFSAEDIARTGENIANRLQRQAIEQNKQSNLETQAIINAALLSGGAAGIHQSHAYGDCWFESSLAAVARVPKGQQLLSNMIIQDSPTSYRVKLHRPERIVLVTREDIKNDKTQDFALWARIIESAVAKTYPECCTTNGRHGKPPAGNKEFQGFALGLLTGARACVLELRTTPIERIIGYLQSNLDVQNRPMVTSSNSNMHPQVTIPAHGHTVIAYDPVKRIVTVRNPWARSGEPRDKTGEFPDFLQFGETRTGLTDIGGGLIQMSVPAFKEHFRTLVWPTI